MNISGNGTSRADPASESRGIARTRQRVKVGSPRVVALTLASLLMIGAVPLTLLWRVSSTTAKAVNSVASVAASDAVVVTPVFSARRLPATLSGETRRGGLRNTLRSLTKRLPVESCLVVDVEGRRIVAFNGAKALMPASSLKLLVAAAALDVLGSDFQFTTNLRGVVSNGIVSGDVWLVGGGDPLLTLGNYTSTEVHPTLSPTRIETLVDGLVASGVTSISGSVVGDESRYDAERYTPSLGLGVRSTEVGPLGALLINDGVILTSPIKPDNPALSSAIEFTRVLTERGISVAGAPKTGKASADLPVIASVASAPLTAVIAEMLTNSDNNTAELLLKEIGLASSSQGTRIAGIAGVRAALAKLSVSVDGLAMTDGSGLDRSNRASCLTLQSVLTSDGGFGVLAGGLALAGRSGTLSDLFTDSSVKGIMRAKTGTLTGAKALAGVVPYSPKDGQQAIIFTLLLNGSGVSNQGSYRPIWSGITEAFAKFSSHPNASEIAPLPAGSHSPSAP